MTRLGYNYNLSTLHFIWAHVLAPCSPCSVSALLALSEQLRLLQVGSTRAQICLVSQRRRSLSTKAERESLEYFAERRYVYICNQPCRRLVYTYRCILVFLKFHPFPCKVEYPELNRNPFFISYPFNPATRASYWTSLKGRRPNTEEMKIHKYSKLCSIPGLVINNGVFTGHCQLSHDCQTHCYY